MLKNLLIGINYLILLLLNANNVFSQNANYTSSASFNTYDVNEIIKKDCEEAINLFYDAYKKQMNFRTDIFEAMKTYICRCNKKYDEAWKNKTQKQINIFLGRTPEERPKNEKWLIESTSFKLNCREKYPLDYETTISDFRNAVVEQQAPDCDICENLVDSYVSLFKENMINRSFDFSNREFIELKESVIRCNSQLFDQCSRKMDKQLSALSGNFYGDRDKHDFDKYPMPKHPTSPWFLKQPKSIFINVYERIIHKTSIGDVIFSTNGKWGVMDEEDFVFIAPNFDSIGHFAFNNQLLFLVKKDFKYGLLFENGMEVVQTNCDKIHFPVENHNFFAYLQNNRWGIIANNSSINEHQFYDRLEFESGWTVVSLNNKIGFLNADGKLKTGLDYDSLLDLNFFTPNLNILPVVKEGKIGFVNKDLIEIISPTYDEVGYPANKLHKGILAAKVIPVMLNGKRGYISDFGKIMIEPKYDEIKGFDPSNWGNGKVSFVRLNNKWGMIENNGGKEITPINYDKIYDFDRSNEITKVVLNSKFGLINLKGEEIINPIYDEILDFNIPKSNNLGSSLVRTNNRWGLFDHNEKKVLTRAFYDKIHEFDVKSRFAKVDLDGKVGLINENGEEIIKPKFDKIIGFEQNYNVIIVQNEGLLGLVNKYGENIAYTIYDFLKFLANANVWKTKIGEKYGILNANGMEIIVPKYQEIEDFKDGLASILQDGKYGIIDTNGNEIIKPQYDSPIHFVNGIAEVFSNGVKLKINKEGKPVINNFENSTLSSLTLDGNKLSMVIFQRLEKIYSALTTKVIASSMSGVEVDVDQILKSDLGNLSLDIERWLGGPMTKTQIEEYNEINKKAEEKSLTRMTDFVSTLISAASSTNNTSSNQNIQQRTNKNNNSNDFTNSLIMGALFGDHRDKNQNGNIVCKWCRESFSGEGFEYKKFRYECRSEQRLHGVYCSPKCAVAACGAN